MSYVTLTGLDGSTPLGLMAALGTLRVLDDHYRKLGMSAPRLSWREGSPWPAVLHGVDSIESVMATVAEELPSWLTELAFTFSYDKKNGLPPEMSVPAGKTVRDLKAKPKGMRWLLETCAQQASTHKGAARDHRSARQVAAYASELVTDNNGRSKPTAFHFTAGTQTFLGAVAAIHEAVSQNSEDDLHEALVGPWTRTRKVKTLGWDTLGGFSARMYALRARNPSGDPRPGIPGAEWLAFVGLSFFPVAARGGKLTTTCVKGGWKDSVFTWPLWSVPASADTISALLLSFQPPKGDAPAARAQHHQRRAARGIMAVFAANILRSDQGGYGAFSPSSHI